MYQIQDNIKIYRNPEVYLIGCTKQQDDLRQYIEDYSLDVDISNGGLSIPEIAGRHCYMSFNKNKTNKDFLKMLFDNKHLSVLEHFHINILLRGISRSFTHEMVRHRLFSYSQCSTRYVNPENLCVVFPPEIEDCSSLIQYFKICLKTYNDLLIYGKDIAREVLPNFMEAPIIVSGNLRSFIEMIDKRNSRRVAKQFRRVLAPLREKLIGVSYNIFFGDIV